jgi:hypothetical protein
MLTRMTDQDWERVVQVFRACRSRRGDKGRDDRTVPGGHPLLRSPQHHLASAACGLSADGTASGSASGA